MYFLARLSRQHGEENTQFKFQAFKSSFVGDRK